MCAVVRSSGADSKLAPQSTAVGATLTQAIRVSPPLPPANGAVLMFLTSDPLFDAVQVEHVRALTAHCSEAATEKPLTVTLRVSLAAQGNEAR